MQDTNVIKSYFEIYLQNDIKLLRKCRICKLYQELQNEIRIFSVSIYFLMHFLYIGHLSSSPG